MVLPLLKMHFQNTTTQPPTRERWIRTFQKIRRRDVWYDDKIRTSRTVYQRKLRKWLWKTYCELIYYVRAGCNKPRFEMLAPANLDAGGDLVALGKYSKHVVAIRAMGGNANLRVNPEEMGRVKITHETCPRLFHVTYKRNITSILKNWLKPGGLDPNGRKEVFFSCKSQAGLDEKESNELYKAACAAMTSNPGQPVLVGYPFKKGDSTICIDTKKAAECGIEFWQTAAMAIVTNKPIPPICFIHVENLKTGGIIMTPPKVSQSVRPPTHHEVSECKRAKPALTPAGKWLESHHVTTSSSIAGGNLTTTNATASDSGIVQVDL